MPAACGGGSSSSSGELIGASAGAAAAAALEAAGIDPARLIKARHAVRAARQARQASAAGLGLDTTSAWRYAGKLTSQAEVAHVARRALARRQALREALAKNLDRDRLDTPLWAAHRDQPNVGAVSSASFELPSDVDDETMQPLRYWAPPSAKEKMPHYMFHEPGRRVRESLLVLEELRGKGGHKRLAARHAAEVELARAHAVQLVHEGAIDREADKAAGTVQRAWRGRGAADGQDEEEGDGDEGDRTSGASPAPC